MDILIELERTSMIGDEKVWVGNKAKKRWGVFLHRNVNFRSGKFLIEVANSKAPMALIELPA